MWSSSSVVWELWSGNWAWRFCLLRHLARAGMVAGKEISCLGKSVSGFRSFRGPTEPFLENLVENKTRWIFNSPSISRQRIPEKNKSREIPSGSKAVNISVPRKWREEHWRRTLLFLCSGFTKHARRERWGADRLQSSVFPAVGSGEHTPVRVYIYCSPHKSTLAALTWLLMLLVITSQLNVKIMQASRNINAQHNANTSHMI